MTPVLAALPRQSAAANSRRRRGSLCRWPWGSRYNQNVLLQRPTLQATQKSQQLVFRLGLHFYVSCATSKLQRFSFIS
jgi:hypothetical protein